MFRFFVRYVITASLIVNSLTLATGIARCGTALVTTVSAEVTADSPSDVFDSIKEDLDDSSVDGGTWVACGLIAMLGGIIGGLVIIVCGVEIIVAAMSRLFCCCVFPLLLWRFPVSRAAGIFHSQVLPGSGHLPDTAWKHS